MKMRRTVMATACVMSAVMGLGVLSGCKGDLRADKNALVIMTEELNELYNPFYSTSGTDMDVVGQTQISMLSTDENGEISYGEDEPTVVLAMNKETHEGGADNGKDTKTTEYTFVLKNGIVFSDTDASGKHYPLTIGDVLFNMYVYLDPAYTGSTTMYSTDIVGLRQYRSQQQTSGTDGSDSTSEEANVLAFNRVNELANVFKEAGKTTTTGVYNADKDKMYTAIETWGVSPGYLDAIGTEDDAVAREQLKKDYDTACAYFREELENDYKSAKESYIEEPYKSASLYYPAYNKNDPSANKVRTGFDEVTSFMMYEGQMTVIHPQEEGSVPDKNKIEAIELDYDPKAITTKEQAIDRVYTLNINYSLHQVLTMWQTGNRLQTEYAAKAIDVLLHDKLEDGKLAVSSISGIRSLGHTQGSKDTVSAIDGNGNVKDYKVAKDHDPDGTPANDNEYDVLSITINGVDPKAQWNFGFTVAPYHYYSDPEKYELNITAEQYGVAWASYDFQKDVIQGNNAWGQSKNKIPVGAGPYVASDRNGSKQPVATGFFSDNMVYYEANDSFMMGKPKIQKLRYQVCSTANAISVLESGQVHFVTPQFTEANYKTLDGLKSRGAGVYNTWQLGYGYIGINARYVKQLNLRKAIMSAMNTGLALSYYQKGTALNVVYPMSMVSWAYPRSGGAGAYDGSDPTENIVKSNGVDYMTFVSDDVAIQRIKEYTAAAKAETTEQLDLKVTFTIAGANMNDHPAFAVFKHAQELLEAANVGWDIEVKPDASALTKLSTGSLEVWAAAWGSTIDPDMYQVYHKNSTATSVKAWGYPEILSSSGSEYNEEKDIIDKLSDLIERAREYDTPAERAPIYKEAMGAVLELAVELPLYQRQTLYAFNKNVIDENSFPHDADGKAIVNSYTSPLSRIWEIEFA